MALWLSLVSAALVLTACDKQKPRPTPHIELSTVSNVDTREAPPVVEIRITSDQVSVAFDELASFQKRRIEELADTRAGRPPETSALDRWRRTEFRFRNTDSDDEPSFLCALLSGPCSYLYERELYDQLANWSTDGEFPAELHPDAPSRTRQILELDDGKLPSGEAANDKLKDGLGSFRRALRSWLRYLVADRLAQTLIITAEPDIPYATLNAVMNAAFAQGFEEFWFEVQTPDGQSGFGYYESHAMLMCCSEPSAEAKPALCRFPWVVLAEDEMRLDICRDEILADSPRPRRSQPVKSAVLIEKRLYPVKGDYHVPDEGTISGHGHTACTRLDQVDGHVVGEQDIRSKARSLGDEPPHAVASSLAESLAETPKTGPCPELRLFVLPGDEQRVSAETFLAAFQAFKTDERYSIPIIVPPRKQEVH